MESYDWTKFTKRINVRADRQELYNAWATPTGLERWFLRKTIFESPDQYIKEKQNLLEQGDTYQWYWYGYPDSVVEKGKVLTANGKDLFRFSFVGDQCTVTVQIKEEAGEQVVELTQENIPLDEQSRVLYHLGCMEGWTFYLANLKSILEGGIDLRNKNEALTKVVNA